MTPSSGGCGERQLHPCVSVPSAGGGEREAASGLQAPDSRAGGWGWGLPSNCETQAPQILRFPQVETETHHCSFYSYHVQVAANK